MGRLERLVIEHYRGASTKLELEFDTAKPVTLIFGENGTGKTTIADALDALGNGEVGSLKDKSSTRTRDHAPTIGKKTADVRIAAHRGSVKWICSLEGDALSTEPTPRPKIRVLRRSQLQRLVTAQPAKRYEELQKFIDVDNVERAENALRDAAANAKQQLDTAAQQQSDASEQLQRVWEEEGTPGSDAVAWAKAIAALDTAELERQARELRALQDDIADAATAVAPYEKAAADAEKAQGEKDTVDAEIETLPATGGQDALGLVEILRHMGQHLKQGTHPNECPVCRQAVDIEHLAGDIDARLATFSQHSALSDRRQAAVQRISRTQQNLDTLRRELMEAARKLLSAITKSSLDALDALRAQVDDCA